MKYNIPFIKPSFPSIEDVSEKYSSIIASNTFTNFGPVENDFRSEIKKYIKQDVDVATFSNATSALMASIVAINGRGDGTKSIIMPSFSFVAGAQAISWSGYNPIFIDINNDNLQADLEKAASVITKDRSKIAGILYTNVFGIGSPDLSDWEALSENYSLPLIIDSAAGFGSKYDNNNLLGSKGSCEIFSFHATKPFAIGEGGAVTTKDLILADKLRKMTNFGFDNKRNSIEFGFNAKMQEFNAAIGLLQFKDFDRRLNNRRKAFEKYRDILIKLGFRTIPNIELSSLCFASFICPNELNRNNLVNYLNNIGIQARFYYHPPIHMQSYFKQNIKLSNTEDISRSIVSLPIHDDENLEYVEIILNEINEYLK
jgi:dTDP-4-amino-4,6-dideoxygalactose transaminase